MKRMFVLLGMAGLFIASACLPAGAEPQLKFVDFTNWTDATVSVVVKPRAGVRAVPTLFLRRKAREYRWLPVGTYDLIVGEVVNGGAAQHGDRLELHVEKHAEKLYVNIADGREAGQRFRIVVIAGK